MRDEVHVAVAVFCRSDGRVLLARRPKGKIYSGYWEFPGGKVEPGESLQVALRREVREELGVEVTIACPWIAQRYDYPHALVRLNLFRIHAWEGTLSPMEQQEISWQLPGAVDVSPVLPANGPVFKALQLPDEYAITQLSGYDEREFLRRLEARLSRGLRLIQVRENQLTVEQLLDFSTRICKLVRRYGARVLINANPDIARMVGADGVHYTSRQLASLERRPDFDLCAASCHRSQDVRWAEELKFDFVAYGPVHSTTSHPETTPLGWGQYRESIAGAMLPVYAIGGLSRRDIPIAREFGSQGVAMIRGSWSNVD